MDKHAWNFKDLTGLRFGRVVVLEENDMSDNRTTIWNEPDKGYHSLLWLSPERGHRRA